MQLLSRIAEPAAELGVGRQETSEAASSTASSSSDGARGPPVNVNMNSSSGSAGPAPNEASADSGRERRAPSAGSAEGVASGRELRAPSTFSAERRAPSAGSAEGVASGRWLLAPSTVLLDLPFLAQRCFLTCHSSPLILPPTCFLTISTLEPQKLHNKNIPFTWRLVRQHPRVFCRIGQTPMNTHGYSVESDKHL